MMMTVSRRVTAALLALACGWSATALALAQDVTYEERNGVRYQVTRRVVQRQVPTTVMQDRQQTVYAPQVTTNTLSHQQLYCVPNTSYQWDSQLRGRWNPFITPYWTYNLRPVTTWNTQVANVQIPVSQVAWVPQTKTVQVPVTAYRNAEEVTTTSVPMNDVGSNTGLASARPLNNNSPSATIAARPATPLGGVALENDPPRQATGGWQTPSTTGRRY